MKIAKMIGGWGLVMACVLVAGCAGASTRLERRFYSVTTNEVPRLTAATNMEASAVTNRVTSRQEKGCNLDAGRL
jgi:hypothetical protein